MSSFFKKYRNLIIAVLLVGLAFSIYSSNLRATGNASFLRRTILNVYSPPLRVIASALSGVKGFWNNYIFLLHVQKENLELKNSLDLLAEQNTQRKELLLENDRLRKLLLLKKRSSARLISAEIIGRDAVGWFKTVLINKGSGGSVRAGQAVVTHRGIVGRTTDVSIGTSKILLITDINSSVDALVQRTRARGIVEGRASGLCQLKYVSSSDDVTPGDLVVTSGLCGVFPKGLPIGTVSRVEKDGFGLFQRVELTPSVNLNKLEEVCILFSGEG